jgi:PAS domain S-box-containing protein
MPESRDEPQSNSDRPGESEPAISMRILDSIADGLVILDRDWRYTYINAHAARIFGRPRSELIGKCLWDLFPFIVGTEMERGMRRAADEQVTCEFQGNDAAAERFYENRAFPTPEGGVVVYFRDITERRRHERLLELARIYADSIVTTVREPLLVLDKDLRVVTANRSFYATFKVGPAETEGRAVYDLGDGQWDIPELRTLLEEIVPANNWFDDFEVVHEFEHIGRKTMLLNARRFPPEGPFTLLLLAIEDITERKQAEEARRESEARFSSLAENVPSLVWSCTAEGQCDYVNPQFARYTGLPEDSFLGPWRLDLIHPDDHAGMFAAWGRSLSEAVPVEFEIRLRRHDGAWRWFQVRAVPLRDASGRVVKWFGTNTDIDDRKRAEEARASLAAIVETSDDAIVSNTLDGIIRSWNVGAERLFGYTAAEAVGQSINLIIPPGLQEEERSILERLRRGERVEHFETVRVSKEGRRIPLSLTVSPLRDDAGRVVGASKVARDITERKRAEAALHESEARFRNMADHSPVMIWVTDPNRACTYLNERWHRFTGTTPEQGLGDRWLESVHPDDRERTRDLFRDANERREPFRLEYRLRRHDGEYRWAIDSAAPRLGPSGEFLGYIGSVLDVTEEKRKEEALRRSESLLAGAQQMAHLGSWYLDLTSGAFDWSDEHYRIFGFEPREPPVTLDRAWDRVHPDDRARVQALFDRAIRDRRPYECIFRLILDDGSVRIVQSRGRPAFDEGGELVRMAGTIQDITERTQVEQALRQSEERFQVALSASPGIMVFSQDMGLRYTWAYNPQFGDTVEDVLGKTDAEILNPEDAARVTAVKRRVLHSGVRAREEMTVTREETRAYDLSLEPLRDPTGQVTGITCVAVDITDRKRLEEALLRAKEAAEAANRSKDEFLANVSHEIRTPFGAILGMTELVLDTRLTDDQRQCLETVKAAADSLLGLVDDLLDFEKIEAGKLDLVPADFSLRAMMAHALQAMTVRAHMKGLVLVRNVEPDVPDALVGDAGRLRQVLLNLVGNAIKFTKQGEVAVRVEVVDGPAPEAAVVLRFVVTDTGIGIPPDGQERIFRAFEQADSSTTREFGGTGLGLTIASRLVALMGGEIGVQSEPGRGSTFALTARFGRQSHPPEHIVTRSSDALDGAATATGVAPRRILVAEDSEFNSRHIERLLGRRGYVVRVATDGREALDLVGKVAVDLLLLDLHMPVLDGFQVIRAIRERERAAGGHLPVIALTARARPEDRERCLAAGMDDYLSKPVRAAELFAAIERMVSAHGSSRATRSEAGDLNTLLDPVALLASCGDDAESLRELCRDFRAFTPARIAELSAALRDRDATRLREAAHKLCGLLSAFSTAAATAASDLEEVADRGEFDEARPLVERLEAMTRELNLRVEGLSLETLRRRGATSGS